jgi:hydroxymethylbilane synthase
VAPATPTRRGSALRSIRIRHFQMKQTVVIGSRGSKLALTQTRIVQAELNRLNPELETRLEIITTSGDVSNEPLSVIGGKGVFTKELEQALLSGRINLAVHSLKDLPTIIPAGLQLAAIGEREDPRDALLIRRELAGECDSLDSLPAGATIGTSSTRRLAQLKHLRPGSSVKDLRGNVDRRLAKLDRGDYDAIILAAAGLRRLGLEDRISVLLSPSQMLPSPGQGALGLETRADDAQTIKLVARLNHEATMAACLAERAFLRALGGGCQFPIAAHAVVDGSELHLDGLVADTDGKNILRDRIAGKLGQAEALGQSLADELLARGASDLLNL